MNSAPKVSARQLHAKCLRPVLIAPRADTPSVLSICPRAHGHHCRSPLVFILLLFIHIVVIFPPHPFISKVKDEVEEAGITVGAQSIFFEDKGAYTGSVAVSMVDSIGCEYVLCGHSERRTLFNDSDDAINRKVKKVLEAGLKPILCIGETKEEYDLKIKNEVCQMQLAKDLKDVTKEQMKDVVIAYEPGTSDQTLLIAL